MHFCVSNSFPFRHSPRQVVHWRLRGLVVHCLLARATHAMLCRLPLMKDASGVFHVWLLPVPQLAEPGPLPPVPVYRQV